MKTLIKTLAFVICMSPVLLVAQASDVAPDKGANAKDADLNKVLARINRSLLEAQAELKGNVLKAASVTLETTAAKSGGGGLKIFVKASRRWARETTNSVTFNFGEPTKDTVITALKKDPLATIIIAAARQYNNAIAVERLIKKSFEVELSFAIKVTTEGGVEFELFGAELEAGADFEKTVFHKIVLKFNEA